MARYHNMLVAVEFSPETKVITEKARQLADLHQARLSLINVVEYSNAYPPEVVTYWRSLPIPVRSTRRPVSALPFRSMWRMRWASATRFTCYPM